MEGAYVLFFLLFFTGFLARRKMRSKKALPLLGIVTVICFILGVTALSLLFYFDRLVDWKIGEVSAGLENQFLIC